MNLSLVVGGIVFAIEVAYRLNRVADVYRGPSVADVSRGYAIGIFGGLAVSAVAAVALVAIAFRLRAGSLIDVVLWGALWWPLTVAVSILAHVASPLPTAVCAVGSAIGAATFWAMSGIRRPQAWAHGAEAGHREVGSSGEGTSKPGPVR